MNVSDSLLCLFAGEVEEQDGSYTIEVPKRELELGDVDQGETYRVAILQKGGRDTPSNSGDGTRKGNHPEPPVEEGESRSVEIEDIGNKGDGIARVGPGYIVFVPDTELGERVKVEITEVRENMAFAEVTERHDTFS